MTTHLAIAHPLFPPDSSSVLVTSVFENRMSLGIVNVDSPSLATVKQNNANCVITHAFLERNLYVMVKPQVSDFFAKATLTFAICDNTSSPTSLPGVGEETTYDKKIGWKYVGVNSMRGI